MGTLLIDDPAPTDDLLSFERISSGWATGTAFDQAWATNPVTSLYRSAEQTEAALGPINTAPGNRSGRLIRDTPTTPLLDNDEAEAQYGIPGQLSFAKDKYPNGVREGEANLLNQWKREEIQRNDILARATPGFVPATARFGAGAAASILDPINIASAFVPVIGEARFAALAGDIGLTAARLARGAAEGVAGAAAVEPLVLLQARSEQADYDAYDSLLNITFGALIGAGLHAGGGFIKDRIVGAPDLRARTAPPAAISPETHETALRGAIAAVAEDRPVQVADLVRASSRRDALLGGTALSTAAEPPVRVGGEAEAVAQAGGAVPGGNPAAERTAAVEAKAREIDPDTFGEYDRLAQERETYGRWIDELADTRQKNAEAAVADLDRQIVDAHQRVDTAPNQRKAKTYRQRLADLQAERDRRVTEATARDTPDMAKVRQKLQAADFQMRDLAEKVSAAKRQAEGEIPPAAAPADTVNGPLDQQFAPPTVAGRSFDDLWEQTRAQQVASTATRPSDTAALSAADAKAKNYAQPATVETESKALAEWTEADTQSVDAQRAAGNLDEADEALLKEGSVAEKQHLDRAKATEALAQCLLA